MIKLYQLRNSSNNVQDTFKADQRTVKKENSQKKEVKEIELKIQRYQTELNKIKKMFPDGFFDE